MEARRGWHGGFRLRESALDRPLLDALVALDGLEVVERRDCAFGLPMCDAEHPCALHPQWEEIRGRFLEMISGTRIRELAQAGGAGQVAMGGGGPAPEPVSGP